MLQTTIAKEVKIRGIGLHTACVVNMRLKPANDNDGYCFYRVDKNKKIEFSYKNVVSTTLSTNIGIDDATISTTEHLMSAIYAYGIDNINIEIDADEIPILDGSAVSFCMLLNEAGIKTLKKTKQFLKINKEITIYDDKKYSWAKISPSKEMEFNFTIDFNNKAISRQSYSIELNKKKYLDNIAKARTFGLMRDVNKMKSMNLIKGGDLNNALLFGDAKVINPCGLRFKDEPVRHKILDAIGDLAILGHNVIGKYESFAGSHNLNHKLTKAIYEQQAYDLVLGDEFESSFN